ncbi:hypothetical protein [Staphylococcus haemolyticus]|uniref:hypothetical protein n=1 Tax=Staphylococcus haemolyticus TaxID=1283 RepID=UPI0015D85C53|nr:hypothetical protein [Staphylococcus haemolyticus]
MDSIREIDREIRSAYKELSLKARVSIVYIIAMLALAFSISTQMLQKGYETLFHLFTVGLIEYIANLMIGGVFVTTVFYVYYRVKKNKTGKGGK